MGGRCGDDGNRLSPTSWACSRTTTGPTAIQPESGNGCSAVVCSLLVDNLLSTQLLCSFVPLPNGSLAPSIPPMISTGITSQDFRPVSKEQLQLWALGQLLTQLPVDILNSSLCCDTYTMCDTRSCQVQTSQHFVSHTVYMSQQNCYSRHPPAAESANTFA